MRMSALLIVLTFLAAVTLYGGLGDDAPPRRVPLLCRRPGPARLHPLLVHYFDRTDEEKLGEIDGSRLWLSTIHDAIGFATRDPKVDPGGIGAVRFSLSAGPRAGRSGIDESKRLANITAASAMISPST